MEAFIVGLVAIIIGTVVAVFGVRVFFVLLPVWGAVAGFVLGASVVAALLGEGFLATGLGWIAGAVVGVAFAIFAGVWFWASIVILSATVGWAIVTGVLAALGFEPGLITLLGGAAGGAVLAVIAISIDAPTIYVAALTAFGGSAYAVAGALLMFGQIKLDSLADGAVGALHQAPIAYVFWLGIAVVAFGFQLLEARTRSADLRARLGQTVP